ncbi:hypothetical protein GCM10025868_41540 [Angustibacter aerolatus]|uniref:NlpC/P60 domain-containing protein n=1 Tax=Angustibacter aerolatus TaxID=1162965 RepID=A0ABQ6JLX7_9ACTN|nr:C40 family peptidase [Angustibacter aerolatus]GMA88904.1 hypothetical protein GCM10025868_41540 [Angustibacter aerolatus]
MTGLEATLARIDDIRSRMAALSAPAATTTTSTGSTTAAGGDFAAALLGATGGTGATATSALGGTGAQVDGDQVVADAKQYLGVPYKWGGTDPATGLDCSGLTQRVFGDLGVDLPRTVAQQRDVGTAVDGMANAKPGDLLVFGSHHIGIYVGDGKMLHAPHTGTDVKIAKVYETPTRIRRVVAAGDGVLGGTPPHRPSRRCARRRCAPPDRRRPPATTRSSMPRPRGTTCRPGC